MSKVRWIGLDVHADTIAVAVAEPNGDVRAVGLIPNRPESIRKLVKKLGPAEHLRVCYEAGPTGYVVYWQLTALGVRCEVVAPTLVPVKAGDRVKTDRRDAHKLARSYRAGDLTPVWVPDANHEALRDLVRAREAAKRDQLRARHRLGKFLLRHGRRPSQRMTPWTQRKPPALWFTESLLCDPARGLEATPGGPDSPGSSGGFAAALHAGTDESPEGCHRGLQTRDQGEGGRRGVVVSVQVQFGGVWAVELATVRAGADGNQNVRAAGLR